MRTASSAPNLAVRRFFALHRHDTCFTIGNKTNFVKTKVTDYSDSKIWL